MKYNEPILHDDEPVYGDYYYIVDGKVAEPKITGFVRDIKKQLNAKEVRQCDLVGRLFKKEVKR